MALPMPKLTRCPKTGDWVSRKVVPHDVKEDYHRLYGVRSEALFRATKGATQADAKREFGDWLGEVESRIGTLRSAGKGLGRTLSQKEAVALAGEWYRWFVGQHEENPGSAEAWRIELEDFADAYRHFAPADVARDPWSDPDESWTKEPKSRPKLRPVVWRFAKVESFLTSVGVHLQPAALDLLLDALMDDVLADAYRLLIRRAEGDYSIDKRLTTFPVYEPARQRGIAIWMLWETWISEKKPKVATVDRWRSVFLNLRQTFGGEDANIVTKMDAQRWASGLVNEERSAQTVMDVWVSAAKTVFAWAKDQKKIDQNPFLKVKVTVPRRIRTRETKAFRTDELRVILRATTHPSPPKLAPYYAAMRRWVPWICGYTGARPGEITQLRGQDVVQQDGVWAIRLTPEAGTIKTNEARIVPLHAHLVEQGCIEVVRRSGKGPLFYDPGASRKKATDPTNPKQPPAVKSRNKLAEWVRGLGVDDPELRPNHAWRHTFKQIAARSGIADRFSDAITGHAPESEGRTYGMPTLVDMSDALKLFPEYRIE